jgi:Zn-dependent protease/CBS domain-containing protein
MRTMRIRGVRVTFHPVWLATFSLLAISLAASLEGPAPRPLEGRAAIGVGTIAGVLFMAAVILHELSHALVSRVRGEPVDEVRVLALGLPARATGTASPPVTQVLVAIAGPIFSALLGLLLVGLAAAMPAAAMPAAAGAADGALALQWGAWWLGLANLGLAAFQLIPAVPLDGGRVVHGIAQGVTGDVERATLIAGMVGRAFGYAVIAAGLFIAFLGEVLGGLWLVLLGWLGSRLARASVDRLRMTRLAEGLTVADVITADAPAIPPGLTLDTLMAQDVRDASDGVYAVVEADRLLGAVYASRVRRSPRRGWDQRRVADAMVPVDDLPSLHPGDPLMKAIESLESGRWDGFPVVAAEAPGRLVGVVTRSRVLERLRARQALLGERSAGDTGGARG